MEREEGQRVSLDVLDGRAASILASFLLHDHDFPSLSLSLTHPPSMSASSMNSVRTPARLLADQLVRNTIELSQCLAELRAPPSKAPVAADAVVPPAAHWIERTRLIYEDVVYLTSVVQKASANFASMLRPTVRVARPKTGIDFSPVQGVQEDNLVMARKQLDSITVMLGKLHLLALAARAEAQVWRCKVDESMSAAERKAQTAKQVERSALEAAIATLGGTSLSASGETGEGQEEEKDDGSEKVVVGAGIGAAFAREISERICALFDAMAGVFIVFMDNRVRLSLEKSDMAKDVTCPTPLTEAFDVLPGSSAQAWERATDQGAVAFAACQAILTKMPKHNAGAIALAWHWRNKNLELGYEELCREAQAPVPLSLSDPGEDLPGRMDFLTLAQRDKAVMQRYLPLIELGRKLHHKAGSLVVETPIFACKIDLDLISDKAQRLSEAQIELACTLMEGPDEESLDASNEDDDDDSLIAPESAKLASISVAAEAFVFAAGELAQATEAFSVMKLRTKVSLKEGKIVKSLAEQIIKLGDELEEMIEDDEEDAESEDE